jgi:hypothetical protein
MEMVGVIAMQFPLDTRKSWRKSNWMKLCQVGCWKRVSVVRRYRIAWIVRVWRPAENSYLSTTVVSGPYVKTVVQWYRQGYYQLFQLFDDGSGTASNNDLALIQVTYGLGVIDDGREVITRINSDIVSGGFGAFYTVRCSQWWLH